jgi:hypothetical protein
MKFIAVPASISAMGVLPACLVVAMGLFLGGCAPQHPQSPSRPYPYQYGRQPISQINQQLWQLQQLKRNLEMLRR